jgi:hypothetical protein
MAGGGDPRAGPADLLTVRAAAQHVGVAPACVCHWIERGLLAAQQGRDGLLVSCADLCAVAEARRQPRSPGGPREMPGDEAESVPASVATC